MSGLITAMSLATSNTWDIVDAQIFVGRQERKRYRENKDRKAKLHFFTLKLSIYFNKHCFNLNSAHTLEYRANLVGGLSHSGSANQKTSGTREGWGITERTSHIVGVTRKGFKEVTFEVAFYGAREVGPYCDLY